VTAVRARRWVPIVAGAAAATGVAMLGGLVTELGPWYYGRRQPAWKPPDWLFGPAWTFIFACAALAGILAWEGAPDRAGRRRVIWLFALNAALNVLWSVLFFRLQRPDWALVEVALLWLSIVVLIWVPASYSRAASWLLVPYLAWVTFAALLNFAVVRLNAPFT
jgi:tryptophan-rich sensory protein